MANADNQSRSVIKIRLTPRSRRDEIAGWREGVLIVRVKAPPVEGRANEALLKLLAKRLRVPARSIGIVSGETARTKILRIEGLDEREVRQRTQPPTFGA